MGGRKTDLLRGTLDLLKWRTPENNRRAKYCRLTSSGRAQLQVEERDWNRVVRIMTAAVESA